MAIVNANALRILAIDAESGTKVVVAHAQSASLSVSNSLIDITTKSSNSWAEKLSGQKSFVLSTSGLIDYGVTTGESNANTVGGWALDGSEVFFDFGIDADGYRGSGFISSYEQSGGTDDAPTYTISVDGNGALVAI